MLFGSRKGGFGASPGVEWSHFGFVFPCFCYRYLLLSNIFWSIGVGGVGGWGEHSFLNHTSQYQNLFSITTSDRHGADLLCNLDPHVVVTTERVWVQCGLSVCTCLSALAFCTCLFSLSLCTSLFALHLVLTPHYSLSVLTCCTSLRRMSFEMIGFGETPPHAGQRLCRF